MKCSTTGSVGVPSALAPLSSPGHRIQARPQRTVDSIPRSGNVARSARQRADICTRHAALCSPPGGTGSGRFKSAGRITTASLPSCRSPRIVAAPTGLWHDSCLRQLLNRWLTTLRLRSRESVAALQGPEPPCPARSLPADPENVRQSEPHVGGNLQDLSFDAHQFIVDDGDRTRLPIAFRLRGI